MIQPIFEKYLGPICFLKTTVKYVGPKYSLHNKYGFAPLWGGGEQNTEGFQQLGVP